MSYELRGDTYRWTYCDKCNAVNGDAYGQVILCRCDTKEVSDAISKIKKPSNKELKAFRKLFNFSETSIVKKKVSKKDKLAKKKKLKK